MSVYQKEEELDKLIVQLKGLLIKYESQNASVQTEKYSEGVLIYERIKCAESAYASELEKLQPQSRESHRNRLRDKQTLLVDLKQKLDHLKELIEANDQKRTEKLLQNGQDLPYNNKLIVWGNELQDKTQDSINRIRDLTIDSEKLGNDVTLDLERQNENLQRVRYTIHGVDENLVSARKSVREIASSILKDKCTIVLVLTIVLLSVCIGLCSHFFKKVN